MTTPLTPERVRTLLAHATPGPWSTPGVVSSSNYAHCCLEDQCNVYPPLGHVGPVAEAAGVENALLIAAAPELAALVLQQAEDLERLQRIEQAARAYLQAEAANREARTQHAFVALAAREQQATMHEVLQASRDARLAGEGVLEGRHALQALLGLSVLPVTPAEQDGVA